MAGRHGRSAALWGGVAVVAFIAALNLTAQGTWVGSAWAQTHSGGSQGGGGHDGHNDGHDDDHEGGHSGKQGGNHGSSHGQGNAGQGGSAQGAGKGGTSGAGGRPAWAREGIPEVELGRLNVARSPDQVLARAFDEALASLSPDMARFYSMSLDEMVVELSTNFDNVSYIDSPLQNLALFSDALDGSSVLTSTGEITNGNDTLLAAFLGVASDKSIPISANTVVAVTTILGQPMGDTAAASLAARAESIRIAVLAGHG